MTKFEELCEIFTKAGNNFNDYRWRCVDFAKEIGDNLANYLGTKDENIQYYLFDKDGKPVEAHPRDALMLSKDTFWHYGMGINLYEVGNKNPSMPFILTLGLKEGKSKFTVQLPQLKKEYNIDPNKLEDFQPVNDLIFNTIKDRFENELEKFLENRSEEHYPEYL